MKLQVGSVLDKTKVAAELRELERALAVGAPSWIAPRLVRVAVLGTFVTSVLPAILSMDPTAILDPSTPFYWTRLLVPTALSVPFVFWQHRQARKQVMDGAQSVTEGLQRQWDRQGTMALLHTPPKRT